MAETALTMPQQSSERLAMFKRMVDDFRTSMGDARARQTRDERYYYNDQLTATQRGKLRRMRTPEAITNRIMPAVNGTIGVVARGKTDPRAYPRTPGDEGAADVASETLRYAFDITRFQRTKLLVLRDILVPGSGAVVVEADPKNGDPTTDQVRWEELVYDPHSRFDDFRDAKFLGVAKWMYADAAIALWPEHREAIEASMNGVSLFQAAGDDFEDRPDNFAGGWLDKKGKRLLVVELYHLENGRWCKACYCAAAIMEDGVSPWVDDRGEPQCGIVAQSGYVDGRNERFGMVRGMIDMQDTINVARQMATKWQQMRQVQQVDTNAPPVDVNVVKREAAKPDGAIPPGWQVVPTSDMIAGSIALQQEAKAEIERMAPIPSMVGRADSGASGRAQLVQSQAGMTEFALLYDGFTDWEQRVARQVWFRLRQFKREPWWVRVTGDPEAGELLQVNEVVAPPQPVVDPMTGQPVLDPQTGQPQMTPPQMRNRLAEMNLDIIIDAVPDTANVQQEQWQELMALLQANPAYAQQVPFSIALEMSSIVGKRQLAKKLKEGADQQMKQQAEAAKAAAAAAEREATAKAEKDASTATLNYAKADATTADAVMDQAERRISIRAMAPGGGSFGFAGALQAGTPEEPVE